VILAGLSGGHRVGHVGAFHQTGWTGLIADVTLCRHGAVRAVEDVLRDLPGGTPQ
jgi:hypothetical protein